jgi:hypothetical protein
MRLPFGRLTLRPEVLAGIVGKTVDQIEGVRLWQTQGDSWAFWAASPGWNWISPNPGLINVNVKIAVMYGYPSPRSGPRRPAGRAGSPGGARPGVRAREVNVYVQEVFLPELELEGGERCRGMRKLRASQAA